MTLSATSTIWSPHEIKLTDRTTGRKMKRTERNGLWPLRCQRTGFDGTACILVGMKAILSPGPSRIMDCLVNIEDYPVIKRVQIYLQSHLKEASPSSWLLPDSETRASARTGWSGVCQAGRSGGA